MSDAPLNALAFDCALGGCVGAAQSARGTASFTHPTTRSQAADLMPLIGQIMDEAGLSYDALDLIVTTIGPGSFTGLRIGLSTARALGLALGIPVQGVTTFEAMARSCDGSRRDMLVVLESKRSDFYTQIFRRGQPQDAACLEPSQIGQILHDNDLTVCGDGVTRLQAQALVSSSPSLAKHRDLLDPAILLALGVAKFKANNRVAEKPEPIYLRGADTSLSNKTPRVIRRD